MLQCEFLENIVMNDSVSGNQTEKKEWVALIFIIL